MMASRARLALEACFLLPINSRAPNTCSIGFARIVGCHNVNGAVMLSWLERNGSALVTERSVYYTTSALACVVLRGSWRELGELDVGL